MSIDLENRYQWNNTKEINDDKLFTEFIKSSLNNKIVIFRLLVSSRRKVIKRKWEQKKKKQEISNFLQFSKFVLVPLLDYIQIENTLHESQIKNYYELMLVFQIMHDIRVRPLKTQNAIDKKNEEKKFNNTKLEMINFLKIFPERKGVFFLTENNNIINQLEELQYTPPTTHKNLQLAKRDTYLEMMYETGIGKERAAEIINNLEKWIKNIRDYVQEEQEAYFRKLCEYDSEISLIDDSFLLESQKYFYYIFNKIGNK